MRARKYVFLCHALPSTVEELQSLLEQSHLDGFADGHKEGFSRGCAQSFERSAQSCEMVALGREQQGDTWGMSGATECAVVVRLMSENERGNRE